MKLEIDLEGKLCDCSNPEAGWSFSVGGMNVLCKSCKTTHFYPSTTLFAHLRYFKPEKTAQPKESPFKVLNGGKIIPFKSENSEEKDQPKK